MFKFSSPLELVKFSKLRRHGNERQVRLEPNSIALFDLLFSLVDAKHYVALSLMPKGHAHRERSLSQSSGCPLHDL
jgi:hypothetical protein